MTYNIYFDIAAIVNLVVVIYAFLIHKHLPEMKNRVFLYLICATLLAAVADIVCVICLANAEKFSVAFLYFIHTIYYLLVCAVPFFYSVYAIALTSETDKLKRPIFTAFSLIPFAIDEIMVLLTPFFHLVYVIGPDKVYMRQGGLTVLYVLLAFQIFYGLGIVLYLGDHISLQKKQMICSFVVLTILGVVGQLIFQTVLLQLFAVSVSLLLIFHSLQSSENITDDETGLFNHRSFQIMVNRSFKMKEEFTVISVYLDDLAFIVKTFGAEGVNTLLGQVSFFLKEIAQDCNVYHIRKDTFCIIVPGVYPSDYSRYISAITKRFNRSWKNENLEIKIIVRQCVIRCPLDAQKYETVIDTLTTAVEDSRYKNEKLLYTENIDVSTRYRFAYVENLVKTAIQEKRIEVFYQPIWSTREGRITGAEALVRMRDREGNFISPEEFVPISEQDGLILRIGMYVFDEVCRFLSTSRIQELGINMIDINLSVAQCMQSRITEEFLSIVRSYNLDISLLNLEITETAAAHTPELLYSNMKKLNHVGFACSLDDYGAGYANLTYILHMPFAMIKIDKDIIWQSFKDVRAYVVLTGIIDMIHKLDIKIVAEGIESKEMVEELSKLKVDYLQGYYYSKPIPENEFYELVKKQAIESGNTKINVDEIFTQDLYPADEEDLDELPSIYEHDPDADVPYDDETERFAESLTEGLEEVSDEE